VNRLGAWLSDYLGFFNPWFLFVTGGPVPTTSTGRAGAFLLPVAALLPIGAYDLLKRWKGTPISMVLLTGFLLSPIPATLVIEPRMIQRGLFVLLFGILIAAFGLARLWQSPARLVRGVALLLMVAVPVQFAVIYRDYFTHYKLRSAFYYDSVSFKDVAEYLIAADRLGSLPGVYLSVELDDAGSKWRFYTTKHGREDLLHRTRYFDGSEADLVGAAPGSLLVTYPNARAIAALLDTKQWSVVRTVLDVDNRAAATILRRIG
jgi:hypothetical protein